MLRKAKLPVRSTVKFWPRKTESGASARDYAFVYTDLDPAEFHFSRRILHLDREHRKAIIAHEVGHVLAERERGDGSEDAADRAAAEFLGVEICYDPDFPGKGLQVQCARRKGSGMVRKKKPKSKGRKANMARRRNPTKAPSAKKLQEAFQIDSKQANLVRAFAQATDDSEKLEELVEKVPATERYVRSLYNDPYDSKIWRVTVAMHAINEILEGHGVEGLGEGRPGDYAPPYEYINMGDTYATTLIYDRDSDRLFIGSWGDVVESDPELSEEDSDYENNPPKKRSKKPSKKKPPKRRGKTTTRRTVTTVTTKTREMNTQALARKLARGEC